MPSLKELQKQQGNLDALLKITQAMQTKSNSLFHKISQAVENGLPYIRDVERMTRRVVRQLSARQALMLLSGDDTRLSFPLLIRGNGKDKRVAVVAFFSEEGLCGAMNRRIADKTLDLLKELKKQQKEITLVCYGSKGESFFDDWKECLRVIPKPDVKEETFFLQAQRIRTELMKSFENDALDMCLLVYESFQSTVMQKIEISQIFPLQTFNSKNPWDFLLGESQLKVENKRQKYLLDVMDNKLTSPFGAVDTDSLWEKSTRRPDVYDYQPSDESLLNQLLPRYFDAFLYQILLAEQMSEALARMTSMDEASVNTKELLQKVRKIYQHKRQSKVTNELLDIVAGTQALGDIKNG